MRIRADRRILHFESLESRRMLTASGLMSCWPLDTDQQFIQVDFADLPATTNQPPEIVIPDAPINFSPENGSVFVGSTIEVTDVDSVDVDGGTLTVSFVGDTRRTGDHINFAAMNDYALIDGDGGEASATRKILVDGIELPVIQVTDAIAVSQIRSDPIVIDPQITVSDADSIHFGGGSLKIDFRAWSGGDELAVGPHDGIEIDGSEIFLSDSGSQMLIGSYALESSRFLGPMLTVNFTDNATVPVVQKLARSITYSTSIPLIFDDFDTRRVVFELTDPDGGSDFAEKLIQLVQPDGDKDGVDDAVEDSALNNGDGNQDGTQDRLQSHVASLTGMLDRRLTVSAESATTLKHVYTGDSPSPSDQPLGIRFPYGFQRFDIDMGMDVGASTVVTVYLDPGVPVNQYYSWGRTADNVELHWYPFMYDGETGAKIFEDRVEIHYRDGGRGDLNQIADAKIYELAGLAVSERPWQNPSLIGDVNLDHRVTALDALLIINDLARSQRRDLPLYPTGDQQFPQRYLDVSGDNSVSALDALRVINLLARISPSNAIDAAASEVESRLALADRRSNPLARNDQQRLIWETAIRGMEDESRA